MKLFKLLGVRAQSFKLTLALRVCLQGIPGYSCSPVRLGFPDREVFEGGQAVESPSMMV